MLQRTAFKRKTTQAPRPERVTRWPTALDVRARSAIQTIAHEFKAQPKEPRAVNRHLLNMAKGQPCLLQSPICVGGTETTVACHGAGIHNGKGMGYKVGDHQTVHGCHACNHYTDAYSRATKAQKEAVFMAGSLRMVLKWREIAAGPASKDQKAAQWALDMLG